MAGRMGLAIPHERRRENIETAPHTTFGLCTPTNDGFVGYLQLIQSSKVMNLFIKIGK
jgi:hypothetical protein